MKSHVLITHSETGPSYYHLFPDTGSCHFTAHSMAAASPASLTVTIEFTVAYPVPGTMLST